MAFSLKYQAYQRTIRTSQIERAQKAVDSCAAKSKKARPNDYKRFIAEQRCTPDGEIAEKKVYSIDKGLIQAEEAFDGFYGVCTNLEDDAAAIAKVNQRRWEIEECFRIMKTEFSARPVYLSRNDRIEAHFITCFLALAVYRILEKRLGEKYTCPEIVQTLQDMNFFEVKGEGYIPAYARTDLTDDLHELFGFRTDTQIVTNKAMKKIFRDTKK